ncbi:hypothetical protein [Hydrogenophaga sp. PAMC20947]|uniref:hypothetical protein n=1 Tax=Hydrogenophaga sp. PAMC20947 TaxID=2565558 RepID=UPI00109DE03F|nr:hypothetical protein [Hydrogenophaga sp. PAMC20947]QCB48447.1 hypothetical protein E5678_21880 [Hydrogenophaga sp. PAMC20947]
MSQVFGGGVPEPHVQAVHRRVTKYLIVIPAPEGPAAKLLDTNRELLAELDANTEEVTSMLRGLTPIIGAAGADWDKNLSGHSAEVRASTAIYTLNL